MNLASTIIAILSLGEIIVQSHVTIAAPASQPAATQPAATWAATQPTVVGEMRWIGDLEQGYAIALRSGRPILLLVGSQTDANTRRIETEMMQPATSEAVGKWTPIYVNTDAVPDVARTLGITTTPVLRLLTSTGREVASRNGATAAENIRAWLDENFAKATALGPTPATASAPDPKAIAALMKDLSGTEPLAREAAVRRLLPLRDSAAGPVAELFATGKLAEKLVALELLESWNAPVSGIDPWDAATISPARVEAIKQWAASAAKADATPQPLSLSAEAQSAARREIRALLTAGSEAEAEVIYERLARVGESLLPVVQEELQQATSDQSRARLTALKYWLVATPQLALGWPGGLARLADTDVVTRHAALAELSKRVTRDDQRLLLALFGDSDPLLREQGLRLLQSTGGEHTAETLGTLLSDPDANVRAAVLKLLAENPDETIVKRLVQYIETEKDADLLVHAVRVLRVTKTDETLEALKKLLDHDNWRVRAEAVEAIHERLRNGNSMQPEETAKTYTMLIKLLDDKDSFVVSRVVQALIDAHLTSAIEPLTRALEHHPEMAADVIRALTEEKQVGLAAMAQLKKLASSSDPRLRAAALHGIGAVAPKSSGVEIRAGLRDTDASVRIAAARTMFAAEESMRPVDGMVMRSAWFGMQETQEKVDMTEWLNNFRAGVKERPTWMTDAAPELIALVAATSNEEKLAAATALVPLGHEAQALPVLEAAAKTDHAAIQECAAVLPWLPIDQRIALFRSLRALPTAKDVLSTMIGQMVVISDPKAADELRSVAAEPGLDLDMLQAINAAMMEMYFSHQYYNASQLTSSVRKTATDAAAPRAASGPELQRTLALSILLVATPEIAADVAGKIANDPAAGEWLRLDAAQVQLLSLPRLKADETAMKFVADPVLRKISVRYLASGTLDIRVLRERIYLYANNNFDERSTRNYGDQTPILPTPPAGLTKEMIASLLGDKDEVLSAYAGYLMALLGDRSGLDPLIKQWRDAGKNDSKWARLVYRAITALQDDSLTPTIEEIYHGFGKQTYGLSEFYWTIRAMKGEQIAKLRKRIRDEVGMQQLR